MGSTGAGRRSVALSAMRRAGSSQACVAVVDDDDSLCRSVARLLRAAGIRAITYPSAEAFLGDTTHLQFDCLLLDIQLPGISGLELQRQLAASGAILPVVFITAHDDPHAREQAQAAGCAGFLRKTDVGSEVLAAVRRAVS
jgi:FixJ family two-component response regulator